MKSWQSRLLRDIVEVVAIVVAGAWAFYVFVFQNVLIPNFSEPTPTFTVEMHHVGNNGPFAVVRVEETIRNIGTVPIYFLAHSITVLGMNVGPRTSGSPPPPLGEYYAYSQFSNSKVVYQDSIITELGDPKQKAEILVQPGTVTSLSREFYVPRNKFDRLVTWLVAGYSKESHHVPTTVRATRIGVPRFTWLGNDVYQTASPTAEIDLKAE